MTTGSSSSLGRRLLPALVLTSAGAGLVVLLDHPAGGSAGGPIALGTDTAAPPAGTDPTATSTPGATTPPTVSSTTPAVVNQAPAPTVAAPPAPTPTNSRKTTPAAPPSTTQQRSTSTKCVGQTVDGPTIDTRWGPVQVEAVVSSTGQICNVQAIQSPSDHRRSVAINQYALPILHTEVMQAQSTNINGVSGATVTSVGYARSLQAILDRIG